MADRYCRNCGHQLAENDLFCANCGTPVNQAASVPTREADVPVPPPPQTGSTTTPPPQGETPPRRSTANKLLVAGCLGIGLIVVLVVFVVGLAVMTAGGGGKSAGSGNGEGDGSKQHTSNNASDKQIIERGKAAREREQNPKPGHAPLPKGDTLEVYYKPAGGAGYAAYAGADGITQPVDFSGPHYEEEHILYHTDPNPNMTIDVTRMTVSGAVEVRVVHDGKQIAHAVVDDSNHNVTIMGTPHDLTVQ